MASTSSAGAGPSRATSSASHSSSSSMTTIQRQAASSIDDSFPAVSSSFSSPMPSEIPQGWHLNKPTDSISGLSFSPSSSSTTFQMTPKKIATSPYRQQRAATHVSDSTTRRRATPQQFALVTLLENTLKLDSLGVSPSIPRPSVAATVTLSNRCRPDAKVIFDQIYFTVGKNQGTSPRQGRIVTQGKDGLAGIGEEDGESLQFSSASIPSQDSGIPSTRSSNTLTSPASTSSLLPTSTTAATSLTPDGDSQSVTSVASSVPPPTSKIPAWSTPRSWAEMASSRGNGGLASSLGTPFSENINGTHGSNISPVQGSNAKFALDSRRLASNGKSPEREYSGPIGLEEVVQHAETRFIAPLTYPRGMINKGNLCFANAILQVLVYCAPFYNLFRLVGNQVAHDFHNSTPLMEAVIYFLSEFQQVPKALQKSIRDSPVAALDLLRDIQTASEPFAPEYVYDAMKLNKRFDAMRRGHQEDAEEFLGFFLDTLHEELLSAMRLSSNRLLNKTRQGDKDKTGAKDNSLSNGTTEDEEGMKREVNRPVSPIEGDGWLEVGQKGRTSFTRTTSTAHSPITRIFGGKLRSLLRMPGSKDSVTLEPYQPLQLDIQPSNVTTIEEALQNLTIPETITGVHSPSLKGTVDATKQVFIETLPPILILHLKRFMYDDIGGVQKSSKVLGYGPTLEVSESIISPARRGEAKRKYKLFGVIYHHGRYASGGHYTVDVLRQDQSEWIHIDDTTWSSVSPPSVRGAGGEVVGIKQHHDGVAYLLFYAREDTVLTTKGVNSINGQSASPPKQATNNSSHHQREASTNSQRSQINKK